MSGSDDESKFPYFTLGAKGVVPALHLCHSMQQGGRWFFSHETKLTSSEVLNAVASIQSPTGELPLGTQAWQRGDEAVKITLEPLATEADARE